MKFLLYSAIILSFSKIVIADNIQNVETTFKGASAIATNNMLNKVGASVYAEWLTCKTAKNCTLKLQKELPASLYLITNFNTNMLLIEGVTANTLYDKLVELNKNGIGNLSVKSKTYTIRGVDPRFPRTFVVTTYFNELISCSSDNDVLQRETDCKFLTVFNPDVIQVKNLSTLEKFKDVDALPYGY